MENHHDCVFCKIIAKEIPSRMEYQDELCTVFHDINPRAKTHMLIVPNRHVATVNDVEVIDQNAMGKMILLAADMARKFSISDYKLQILVGKKAGQEVFHVHMHLMSVP